MNNEIINDLRDTYSELFANERHFTYLYGSQAYCIPKSASDLDLVTVVDEINPSKLKLILEYVIEVHKKYDLEIDNEVPHHRKLITTLDMMSGAVEGRGFHYETGRVIIPELKKTKEYLLSDELMYRLLLNTITGKSLFISGDESLFYEYKDEGWDTMFKVIYNMHNQSLTVPEFVERMIGNCGREGESYMGYKNKPLIRRYLEEEVSRRLESYHKKGLLTIEEERGYKPKYNSFMILPKWKVQ